MKAGSQAMLPEFFRPDIEDATKKIKKPRKEDNNLLLELSESPAWGKLKDIITSIQINLTEQAKAAVGKATSWEQVGKIYYGRDVSIDSMQSIVDIVERHKKAKYAKPAKE